MREPPAVGFDQWELAGKHVMTGPFLDDSSRVVLDARKGGRCDRRLFTLEECDMYSDAQQPTDACSLDRPSVLAAYVSPHHLSNANMIVSKYLMSAEGPKNTSYIMTRTNDYGPFGS
jgi:hypothetical protein